MEIADMVILVDEGRIVDSGKLEHLLSRANVAASQLLPMQLTAAELV
jgi:ABC-type thiamine transport system ATPase subunit